MQDFIKLSSAVYELTYSHSFQDGEDNAAVASVASNIKTAGEDLTIKYYCGQRG